jgi:hypothetical protein
MSAHQEMPPEVQAAMADAFRYVRQHLDGDPAAWVQPAEVPWFVLPGLAHAMIVILREMARLTGQDEDECSRQFLDHQIEVHAWGALESDVSRLDAGDGTSGPPAATS